MNLKQLNEELDNILEKGKYFYIIGEAEEEYHYLDTDIGASVPDYRTWDSPYISKERYNTFKEVCAILIQDGYWNIYDKVNFPKEYDLEEVEETDCTPEDMGKYIVICSYWCEREEEFGPEERPHYAEVTRLIEICKEK